MRDAVLQEAEEEERPALRRGRGQEGGRCKQQSNVNGKIIIITIIMI
jgi:hypothetical protein